MKLHDYKLEPQNETLAVLRKHGFNLSRMIAYSKSTYLSMHPEHQVVFNANIFTPQGKAWWGDLDLTKDSENLQLAAADIGSTLYVLRESDGRFGNEQRTVSELEKLAVKKFEVKSKQKKSIQTCLQSLASKVTQFFSATRRR